MTPQTETFEAFVLLELMGRQRIAGRVTERVIAGVGFLQVDVPETKHSPKFTRLISPNSLYAINPIDEGTMHAYAESLRVKPIDAWDIQAYMQKVEEQRLLKAAEPIVEEDDRDYDELP